MVTETPVPPEALIEALTAERDQWKTRAEEVLRRVQEFNTVAARALDERDRALAQTLGIEPALYGDGAPVMFNGAPLYRLREVTE